MGSRQITTSWTEATKLQLSPAATPPWNSEKQDDELQFLRDSHYFMHGEVIAFTVIAVFFIFLLFLVIHCLRRTITLRRNASETSESTKKRNCLLLMPRKRKADDHEQNQWLPEPFDEKGFGIHQGGFGVQNSNSR